MLKKLFNGYGKSDKQEFAEKIESNYFDRFVIPIDSMFKNRFDALMLFASCINVFS
jgi:hypothetical protein